jgi:hypothetical protein
MEKLEKGEDNLFNIIRPKRLNLQPLPYENNPRKRLFTFHGYAEDAKASPAKKYNPPTNDENFNNTLDKNQYDIQGYCKKINDMMLKQEEVADYALARADMNKRMLANPSPRDNGSNLALHLKIKTDNEEQENRMPCFIPYMKKDGGVGLTIDSRLGGYGFGKDYSPRAHRDSLMLSPLFSANPVGGFFSGFTPRYFSNIPHMAENSKGLGPDDFLMRPSPTHMDIDINSRFDKAVDNLKMEIRQNAVPIAYDQQLNQKGLNLDIDLIDDSYLHVPLTKSPNMMQFSGSQPTSKCSFKKFGEWTLSPNASFLPSRKKF